MSFKITPSLQIIRDREGFVRQISHQQEPYAPKIEGKPTPQALADQYLREVAEFYGIDRKWLENLEKPIGQEITDEGTMLQRVREKTTNSRIVIAYRQTHFSLPIWKASFTVWLQREAEHHPLNILLSASSIHHKIEIEKPRVDAKYTPGSSQIKNLISNFAENIKAKLAKITSDRLIIYRFDPKTRVRPKSKHLPETVELSPLPKTIREGNHYIVTDVLFTLNIPDFGELDWRALIEIQTGAILYIRALIWEQTGLVYSADPITSSGNTGISAADSDAVLDPLRTEVNLVGLNPPTPQPGNQPPQQELMGEYVEVVDFLHPFIAPPTEPAPYNFTYHVRTDDFSAVNAYHHVDALFRIMEDLGFDISSYFSGFTFPLRVDHRSSQFFLCPGGNCVNAFATPTTIIFMLAEVGQPVGIAVDPRVSMHEFCHFVLFHTHDDGTFDFCHSFGDSLAVIRMDPESALRRHSDWRFRTFPFLYHAIDRRHDCKVGNGWAWGGTEDDGNYGSEEILSTTLFRIYRAMGGDDWRLQRRQFAARYMTWLLFRSCQSLLPADLRPVDTPEFYAHLLMDVDFQTSWIWGGHSDGCAHKVIRWGFEKQGAYQLPNTPTPITQEGSPPAVDVYIDDGRDGEYYYERDYASTKDIWNRHSADGVEEHQIPNPGVTNYAYVRVKNRGYERASNVFVKGYHAEGKLVDDLIFPKDWQPLTTEKLSVPDIPPNGEAVVGPFEWIPQAEEEYLLMAVNAFGDLSIIVAREYFPTGDLEGRYMESWSCWRLVPLDNNAALRYTGSKWWKAYGWIPFILLIGIIVLLIALLWWIAKLPLP